MANITDYDDVYDFARDQRRENEVFYGRKLNKEKAERVVMLQNFAQELARRDKDFKCIPVPIDDRSRHAGVQLELGLGGYVTDDARVKELICALHRGADLVGVVAFTEKMVMNFDILDVWDEPGTIYDRKK